MKLLLVLLLAALLGVASRHAKANADGSTAKFPPHSGTPVSPAASAASGSLVQAPATATQAKTLANPAK